MYNASKTIDVSDVWPETKKDLSVVEWAHAVNSEAKLKAALWGKSSKSDSRRVHKALFHIQIGGCSTIYVIISCLGDKYPSTNLNTIA